MRSTDIERYPFSRMESSFDKEYQMKQFMDDNFLLKTKTAQILFHDYAKDEMIYDYHCHLIPQEIAENKRFTTITDAWLGGDHYKWRDRKSVV